jgi:uncharacterized integral membrane protein
MANPEHIEQLDFFDKYTVVFYRTGLSLFSLSILFYTLSQLFGLGFFSLNHLISCSAFAGLLSASSLHIYDKKFRWIFAFPTWLALTLGFIFAQEHVNNPTFSAALLGLVYITFSGLFIKEFFSFRIFGLPFTPLFLASSLIPQTMGNLSIQAYILIPVAILGALLSYKKWSMPLHFDVGNRSYYQN